MTRLSKIAMIAAGTIALSLMVTVPAFAKGKNGNKEFRGSNQQHSQSQGQHQGRGAKNSGNHGKSAATGHRNDRHAGSGNRHHNKQAKNHGNNYGENRHARTGHRNSFGQGHGNSHHVRPAHVAARVFGYALGAQIVHAGHNSGYGNGGYGNGGACHFVSKIEHGRHGYRVQVGGTMCYDDYGQPYIVQGSRYVIGRY